MKKQNTKLLDIATGVMWIIWFVALTATPFFLADPYRGPVLNGFYAWMALGLLAGCLLDIALPRVTTRVFQEKARDKISKIAWLRAIAHTVFAIGALIAIAMCVTELFCLPVVFDQGSEFIYDLFPLNRHHDSSAWTTIFPINIIFEIQWRLFIEEYGKWFLSVSSFLCAIFPLWANVKKHIEMGHNTSQEDESVDKASGYNEPSLVKSAFILACMAGFLKEPLELFVYRTDATDDFLMQQILERFGFESFEAIWCLEPLSLTAVFPSIMAILLGLMLCFGRDRRVISKTNVGSLTRQQDRFIFQGWGISCWVLVAYALSVIVWNFLSRSVLIYNVMPHVGWLVLSISEVAAVLCLFIIWIVNGRMFTNVRDAQPNTSDAVENNLQFLDNEDVESSSEHGSSDVGHRIPLSILYVAFGQEGVVSLTDRERQAFELMLAGETSARSSEVMGISASTVRAYLQRAYKKLDLKNGEEASAIYGEHLKDYEDAKQEGALGSKVKPGWKESVCYVAAIVGILVISCALVPIGVSKMHVTDGRPFIFGVGAGLMLFGLFTYCLAWEEKRLHFVWVSIAVLTWVAFIGCRIAIASISGQLIFLLSFLASVAAAFAFGVLARSAIEQRAHILHSQLGKCPYTLARNANVMVWLVVSMAFVGIIVQMAWTDLDRPVAASLFFASGVLLVTYLMIKQVLNPQKVMLVAIAIIALALSAIGRETQVLSSLTLALVLWIFISVPLARRRVGLVFVSLGAGLAFGRIATNYCNDLMRFYSFEFEHLDPAEPIFGMIGFAASVVLLLLIAYTQVRLFLEIRAERTSWQNEMLFADEESERAKAFLKAKGFTDSEIIVGIGILKGRSSSRIANDAYLSLGSINSARLALYRGLGVNSKEQFVNAIKEALNLS